MLVAGDVDPTHKVSLRDFCPQRPPLINAGEVAAERPDAEDDDVTTSQEIEQGVHEEHATSHYDKLLNVQIAQHGGEREDELRAFGLEPSLTPMTEEQQAALDERMAVLTDVMVSD